MIRSWFLHTGMYSGLGAALAFAAICLQLMVGVARQARPRALVRLAPAVQQAARPGVRSQPVTDALAPNEAEKETAYLRLTLSVLVGHERAEVFVNSRRVGETPYLGDYSCRRGEALTFEIVPKKGPLIVRSAVCAGSSLRIRD